MYSCSYMCSVDVALHHAYVGIKELLQLWLLKRDNLKHQRPATTMGSQAAVVVPANVAGAEDRLERLIRAVSEGK